jgi:type IV pilus assembly protein PilE
MKPRASSPRMRAVRGLTLVEVMIVVVIIGILASIAYPAYQQYVLRAARAEAQAILMEAAQFMERYHTTNNRYTGAVLPFNVSPKTGTVRYNISFSSGPTDTTYTVQAVPTGPQARDACGTLTIDHTGATGAARSDCW